MDLIVKPIYFENMTLFVLDQSRLPQEEIYIALNTVEEVVNAIKLLKVRGAPAIGIAASYGYVIGLSNACDGKEDLLKTAQEVRQKLESSRPTAVNLFNCLRRMHEKFLGLYEQGLEAGEIIDALLKEARAIQNEDIEASLGMAENFLKLIEGAGRKLRVLTHCNTGALATGGLGTALYVIRAMHERGLLDMVYVTETRPLLQGLRLTAWELSKYGIPYRIIVDSAGPFIISNGEVDAVIVGADRVARNGDTANKIGTLSLAMAADRKGIPFFVICPSSTFDDGISTGSEIPVEYRSCDEVVNFAGVRIAPENSQCLNPAFDITPSELISAIVYENGARIYKGITWQV